MIPIDSQQHHIDMIHLANNEVIERNQLINSDNKRLAESYITSVKIMVSVRPFTIDPINGSEIRERLSFYTNGEFI
ncbi:MAG: hypothetical protein WD061_00170 [Candidatus Saccharimonadales bacterium]